MTFFVGPQICFCTPSCFFVLFLVTSSNLFWTSLKINSLEPPKKNQLRPPKKIFWCYYLHTSRESVSAECCSFVTATTVTTVTQGTQPSQNIARSQKAALRNRIVCRGIKLFLLKWVTTTVTTATVTTVTIVTVTICVFRFCHN